MSEQNINAWCTICGNGYHVCNSCHEQKSFNPWRIVTDSREHYLIYLIIHEYNRTKNKEAAAAELTACNLSGYQQFKPEIRAIIEEILADAPLPVKAAPAKSTRKRTTKPKKNLNE